MSDAVLVNQLAKSFPELGTVVAEQVLVRVQSDLKAAVHALERIQQAADTLKQEFPEISRKVIIAALIQNQYKLKRTVKELKQLRGLARLRKKHSKVSPDVLAKVWANNDRDYARTDAELRELEERVARLRAERSAPTLTTATTTASSSRPTSSESSQSRSTRPLSIRYAPDTLEVPPPQRRSSTLGRSGGTRSNAPSSRPMQRDDTFTYTKSTESGFLGDDYEEAPPLPAPATFREAIVASRNSTLRRNQSYEEEDDHQYYQRQFATPPQNANVKRIGAEDDSDESDTVLLDLDRHPQDPYAGNPHDDDDFNGQIDVSAIAAGLAQTSNDASHMQARALFDYNADRADKLAFRKGAVIEVTRAGASEWWRGRLLSGDGSVGKFPRSYVRPVAQDITAVALYPFNDTTRPEHLQFAAGDELVLLNRIPQSAWWEALSVRSGRCGIAPVNFFRIETNQELFDDLNA